MKFKKTGTMKCNVFADEIKALRKRIGSNSFNNKEDVREFIKDYTKLIYDHKMIGLLYDYYDENIIYRKENRITIIGVEAVVVDILELLSMFPDMAVDLEEIIISGDSDKGYKVWRRIRYRGTNLNHTKYGPPSNKELGDGCIGLSMMFINKVNNSWKITEEHNTISSSYIRDVCTISV